MEDLDETRGSLEESEREVKALRKKVSDDAQSKAKSKSGSAPSSRVR
jgi:hypothetical protein